MRTKNKNILIIGFAILILFIISGQWALCANPPEPSDFTISASNYSPNIGDTVTVTLSEIPYGAYTPDAYVWFDADVYYGPKVGPYIPDTVNFIVKDWNTKGVAATYGNKFQATFSFVPQQEGVITIDASANRQYDVTFANTQIHAYASSNINQNGNGNYVAGGSMDSITCLLGAIVVIIVVVLIIILLLKRKKKDATIQSIEMNKIDDKKMSEIQMGVQDKPSDRIPIDEIKNQEKKSMNFCPDCGTKIERAQKFCPECGFKL